MPYSLRRLSDGAGDSGQMSMNIYEDENGEIQCEDRVPPRVGVAVRVGSHFARTFGFQDWWQTSYVTEILEESEGYVKFKTNNSVYEWKRN